MSRPIKFRQRNGKDWHYFGFIGEGFKLSFIGPVELHSESIGQFTGLLDRNGKEIYEGDVVSFFPNGEDDGEGPMNGEVVYSGNRAAFQFRINGMTRVMIGLNIPTSLGTGDPPNNCEVIGNIHQHPELLLPM